MSEDNKNLNPVKVGLFLSRTENDPMVLSDDKEEWLDNPCTAIFFLKVIQAIHESFGHHLAAQNMNTVCEYRGAYRALLHVLEIPQSIRVSADPSLDREQAREMKRKIEEMLNVEE